MTSSLLAVEPVPLRPGVLVRAGDQRTSSNAIVRTADGLVLIDAPLCPTSAMAWRRVIDRIGLPVRYLIYTDHHPDHTTGSHWLPGTVVAHQGTRDALAAGPPDYLLPALARVDPDGRRAMDAEAWRPRLPEITFGDRLALHVGGVTFDLIHLPGHTPNTIAVHLPDQRVLFTGDNVITIDWVPGLGDLCLHEHLAAFETIEALDSDVLVPGHGPVTDATGISGHRARMASVIAEVQRAIDAGLDLEQVLDRVSYADVHAEVDEIDDPGYEPTDVAMFQRVSVTNVYRQLRQRPIDRRGWGITDGEAHPAAPPAA